MAYALRFNGGAGTMELIVQDTGEGVDCHVMTEVESEQTLADVVTRWSLIYGPIPSMMLDIRKFLGRNAEHYPDNWRELQG